MDREGKVARALDRLANGVTPRAKSGGGWMVRCPGHEDRAPSLSVDVGRDWLLLACFAGCSTEHVITSVGLTWADIALSDGAESGSGARRGGRIVQEYAYRDGQDAATLYEVVRFEPKDFRQRRPVPGRDNEWAWGLSEGWYRLRGAQTWRPLKKDETPDPAKDLKLPKVERVLYRLPELRREPNRVVVVVEGEKDVEALRGIGVLATCNAQGAGKWTRAYSEELRGRRVFVLPDKDEPGQRHGQQVATGCARAGAAQVRLAEWPGNGKDAADWVATGGTREAISALWRDTPPYVPPTEEAPEGCDFTVGVIQVHRGNPSRWTLEVDGKWWIKVDKKTLLSPSEFQGAVLDFTGTRLLEMPSAKAWRVLVRAWLVSERAQIHELPPEAREEISVGDEIESAVGAVMQGERWEDVARRRRWVPHKGGRLVQTDAILSALKRRDVSVKKPDLCIHLRDMGWESKVVRLEGKQVRAWWRAEHENGKAEGAEVLDGPAEDGI